MIVDKREGRNIDYLAIPNESIDSYGGDIPIPRMDVVDHEDSDKTVRKYVAVIWKDHEGDDVKTYDSNGHVVVAGCKKSDITEIEGKLQCSQKSLYRVLHPISEWSKHHIVEITE